MNNGIHGAVFGQQGDPISPEYARAVWAEEVDQVQRSNAATPTGQRPMKRAQPPIEEVPSVATTTKKKAEKPADKSIEPTASPVFSGEPAVALPPLYAAIAASGMAGTAVQVILILVKLQSFAVAPLLLTAIISTAIAHKGIRSTGNRIHWLYQIATGAVVGQILAYSLVSGGSSLLKEPAPQPVQEPAPVQQSVGQ